MLTYDLRLEELPGCPLCGAQETEHMDCCTDPLVGEINRYLPPSVPRLPELRNHRRACRVCGLVYLSPRLDESSLSKVYELWYGYAYRRVVADEQHIADRLHEFSHYHLRTLSSAMPDPGRLLDVGCGSGLFMHAARETGWDVVGIEWDGQMATAGRSRFDVTIRQGTLHDAFEENEQFDAISLFDYLEHSPTPGADLERVCRHLRDGGVLLIRVPNLGGWQSRLMRGRWLAVICNHLSYFSRDVLCRALAARGLAIDSTSAFNYQTELDMLRQRWQWMRQRLGAANPVAAASDSTQGVVPGFASGMLAALGRWLYSLFVEQVDHIGGWFDQGNNLMVVARKTSQ